MKVRDITFLKLQPAVLCVECELISYNNTDHCLACGSRALLSLSRVLGGSLQAPPEPSVLMEPALDRLLSPVSMVPAYGLPQPAYLRRAMDTVVEHAFTRTRADGAALALDQGGSIVCTASMGSAPPVGAELRADRGISGLCVRTGRAWRCDDVERDPHVDARRCRDLGARSVVVAPVAHLNRVMGALEVLSSKPSAFDDHHVANVQLMANLMVLAMMSAQTLRAQTPALPATASETDETLAPPSQLAGD
jgi:GAF domain-containing protein